eukprot:536838-Prorocentrum_minimum.AAC.1
MVTGTIPTCPPPCAGSGCEAKGSGGGQEGVRREMCSDGDRRSVLARVVYPKTSRDVPLGVTRSESVPIVRPRSNDRVRQDPIVQPRSNDRVRQDPDRAAEVERLSTPRSDRAAEVE